MAGITGKDSLSFKKLDVKESKVPAIGFNKTLWMHKATAGQTVIDLTALVTPPEAAANGFAQPSVGAITSSNLMQFKENLVLKSSLRGDLQLYLAYVVNASTKITLLFPAEDGEIFTGIIDHNAKTGFTLVDGQPIVASGVLLAGTTDFNVGVPFRVGQYPSQQHGEVMVMKDGQLQYRNSGNQPPGPGVVGDYYEVPAGAGLGVLIRFNQADLVDDHNVSVLSVGSVVERPNGSQMALVESVAGQLDSMVPTLAALAGVPTTNFQAAPNSIDLKAFGDRVLALEKILDVEIPNMTQTQTYVMNIGSPGTPPTKGTIIQDIATYREVGNWLEITWEYAQSAGGSAGSGLYLFPLPPGYEIDPAFMFVGTQTGRGHVGFMSFAVTSGNTHQGAVMVYDAFNLSLKFINTADGGGLLNDVNSSTAGFSDTQLRFSFKAFVPIKGQPATRTIRDILGL